MDSGSNKVTIRKQFFNFRQRSYDLLPQPKLGKAIIFNNENFKNKKLEKREGTEKDVKSMKELLTEMGFDPIEVYQDKTQIEAMIELKKIAEENHEDCKCFFAVFLSHGEKDKVMMTEGQLHVEDDILALFRSDGCKSLKGKPKIFFFQACRGGKREIAVDNPDRYDNAHAADAQNENVEEVGVCSVTPAGADFLVCYATTNGNVAYRNREDGSWFIQAFVKVSREYMTALKDGEVEEIDFLSLVTLVADNVAAKEYNVATQKISVEDKESNLENYLVQMPCIVSTLKKRIYFPHLKKVHQTKASIPENDQTDEESDENGCDTKN